MIPMPTPPCTHRDTTGLTDSCPGPDTTITHTQPDPTKTTGGLGKLRTPHDVAGYQVIAGIDLDPLNWCGHCQTSLAACYAAGCGPARDKILQFGYAAAQIAIARAAYSFRHQNLPSGAYDTAMDTAMDRVLRDITRLPNRTVPPGTKQSIVGYLANYLEKDAVTFLAAQSKLPGDLDSPPRDDDAPPIEKPDIHAVNPDDIVLIDNDDSGPKHGDPEERIAADRAEKTASHREGTNIRLLAEVEDLISTILGWVVAAGHPPLGQAKNPANRPAATTIVESYLDQLRRQLPQPGQPDRDNRHGQSPPNDGEVALIANIGKSTTNRYRKNRLIPLLREHLTSDPTPPDGLAWLITWLESNNQPQHTAEDTQ